MLQHVNRSTDMNLPNITLFFKNSSKESCRYMTTYFKDCFTEPGQLYRG